MAMPRIQVNGADLYYEDTGAGPEAVVFAHGLLWSGRMFDAQVAALKQRYRCITFDFRGQGRSEVTPSGYDMDTLAEDSEALIEALGVAPCHFVGLSMGGFIGMRLAARRPELIRSLALLETTADAEPEANVPRYKRLAFLARWLSMRLVGGQVMAIMFSQKFLNDPGRAAQREAYRRLLLANNKVGKYRATLGVVNRRAVAEEIGRIRAPTLVVVGDQDVATVPAKSEGIRERIPNARLVVIPGAGHSSTMEEPEAVNAALAQFLDEQSQQNPK
jgi:pimeloyl-ACP methyl ester carboxylesterase